MSVSARLCSLPIHTIAHEIFPRIVRRRRVVSDYSLHPSAFPNSIAYAYVYVSPSDLPKSPLNAA